MNNWTNEQLRYGLELIERMQANWKATTDVWRKHSDMCRALGYALYGPLDEEVFRAIPATKAGFKCHLTESEKRVRETEVDEFAVKAMQAFFPGEEYRK